MGREKSKKNGQMGFTMVDLAIILVILGLVLVPLIKWYDIEQIDKKNTYAEGQFTNIEIAIAKFVQNNGYYPRPSSLILTENDANYGLQYMNGTTDDAAFPANCPNDSTAIPAPGVCTIDPDGTADNGDELLLGAVPFQSLLIDQETSLDYWANKITYVVSASQAEVGTGAVYDRDRLGQVQMVNLADNLGALTFEPAGTVIGQQMLLISHGENGSGAYSQGGALVSACPANVNLDANGLPPVGGGNGREVENCDMDEVFFSEKSYVFGGGAETVNRLVYSMVEDVNYYDDFTSQIQQLDFETWYENTTQNNFSVSEASRLGIGTTTPDQRVHVEGDVLVSGDAAAPAFCGRDADCFDPQVSVAGDVTDSNRTRMHCHTDGAFLENPVLNDVGETATQAITSIGLNEVQCTSTVDTSGNGIDGDAFVLNNTDFTYSKCPTGQLMIGFELIGVRGRAKCALVP